MTYTLWDSYRGKIKSKKGGWITGKAINSHGYDMMNDLVGKHSYMQIIMLNATGRMPSRALADWLEAAHICLSWPDPRIWCNRIGALGGSAGASVVASTCAGVLSADSMIYGIKPFKDSVAFIQKVYKATQHGENINDIINENIKKHNGKLRIMGYARPVAKGDERIKAMTRVTQNLGFNIGPHLQLAFEIEEIILKRFDESMNIAMYISAFLSDQGYSPKDVYRLLTVLVFSGITACHTDAAEREHGTFSPLQVTDVLYTGVPARTL